MLQYEELNEEIKKDLKSKGYANKSIDYKEFLELYTPYKTRMSEKDFARILTKHKSSYNSMKYNGSKITILEPEEVSEERKEEIINELREKGYSNALIDYEEFLELYTPYKEEMTEKDFANILRVSSYNNLKSNKAKAKILKTEKLSQEETEKIRKELIQEGYTNKSINYQEFLELYARYKKQMTEKDFMQIVGITDGKYSYIKHQGGRTKILRTVTIEKARVKEILYELKEKGYTDKSIDYEEFLELYAPYKTEMTEKDFASILGIDSSYYVMKSVANIRLKILTTNYIEDSLKNKIQDELREKDNSFISYQEFLELYNPYKKEMTENDFANILGIASYTNMKNRNNKSKITFKKQLLERVKYQINLETRDYKKQELQDICEKNGITLYELLCDINQTHITKRYDIIDILMQRDSIYIGQSKVSKEFLKKYAQKLFQKAKQVTEKLGKKYNLSRLDEDIASESILYVLQNKGDIEKNSKDDDDAFDRISAYMYVIINYAYIKNLGKEVPISLNESLKEFIKDKSFKSPESIIETIDGTHNDGIIYEMNGLYEFGMSRNEIIQNILQKYKIKEEDLLEILNKELQNKRKIKENEQGEIYLGEEYDN